MPIDRVKLAAQLRKQKRKVKGVGYSPTLAANYASAQIQIVKYITRLAYKYLDYLKDVGIVKDSVTTFGDFVSLANREWIAKQQDAATVNAVKRIDKYHREKFISEFRDKAGINLQKIVSAEKLEIPLKEKIKENINLITNANSEQLDRLDAAFNQSILSGQEATSLDSMIAEVGETFASRARLIARDQTSKFIGELNKERQVNIGIPGYYWRTVGDNAVRDSHAENDGQYFTWDNPPAETGNPGEDIQCRCVADPAIDKFLEGLPNDELE